MDWRNPEIYKIDERFDIAHEQHRDSSKWHKGNIPLGHPLDKIPLKFLWNKPFHRNFIGFVGTQSFIPKGFIVNEGLRNQDYCLWTIDNHHVPIKVNNPYLVLVIEWQP
jgi:hypothetical protein